MYILFNAYCSLSRYSVLHLTKLRLRESEVIHAGLELGLGLKYDSETNALFTILCLRTVSQTSYGDFIFSWLCTLVTVRNDYNKLNRKA